VSPDRAHAGTLYVVATPIGDVGDISPRAVEILSSVEFVACEDTRSAGRLLSAVSASGAKLLSCFEHNEERRTAQILDLLERGADVALVSEAGTPTVSDPGYRLVSSCVAEGFRVSPIPGPCAAVAALSASGLPTDRFIFLGFPAKKGAKLDTFIAEAIAPARTSVCYLPARRVPSFLEKLAQRAGDAQVVIARELTKTYEEFLRGNPETLLQTLEGRTLRGECTLLVYVAPSSRRQRRAPSAEHRSS